MARARWHGIGPVRWCYAEHRSTHMTSSHPGPLLSCQLSSRQPLQPKIQTDPTMNHTMQNPCVGNDTHSQREVSNAPKVQSRGAGLSTTRKCLRGGGTSLDDAHHLVKIPMPPLEFELHVLVQLLLRPQLGLQAEQQTKRGRVR